MYSKYTTDAIVLAHYVYGEYDRTFTLYTRDFGLIRARASAVRKMESRQRYALTLFSIASVSLVRGERGWRVAGAKAVPYMALSQEGVHTYARIIQLVMRLVQGEEPNHYFFEVLRGAREACVIPHTLSLASTELLCVARLLFALGYLSPQALTTALFTHAHYKEKDLHVVEDTKKDMLTNVNQAIAETQL
jgi:DNA repair protein RecO